MIVKINNQAIYFYIQIDMRPVVEHNTKNIIHNFSCLFPFQLSNDNWFIAYS